MLKDKQGAALKASLGSKDGFSILLTGFGKRIIKFCGTSWLTTGWWCMSNAAPGTKRESHAVNNNNNKLIIGSTTSKIKSDLKDLNVTDRSFFSEGPPLPKCSLGTDT